MLNPFHLSNIRVLFCLVVIASGRLLGGPQVLQGDQPNIVVAWNAAVLQGVRDSRLGPPMVARALAIVHTCIYDAWAAYDDHARGTLLAHTLRRARAERTLQNKQQAISFAAFRAAIDLFPADGTKVFRPLMQSLGYDPDNGSTDLRSAAGVGNRACQAVLDFRHDDGSNQLGAMSPGGAPYSDYTGYVPWNAPSRVPSDPSTVSDPSHWQPLQYYDPTGNSVTQMFVGAQWFKVVPFALSSGSLFRRELSRLGPATYGSTEYLSQAEELVQFSANLTDEQKMIAEYFADGPHSELPPGHWNLFAQVISARDHHDVDNDVKMFFALNNAIFDAGIVAWDAKRAWDSVRPATALPYLFQGQQIQAWGGPGKGTIVIDGRDWIPYQLATAPTPSFPEYISGHSTFSAAGAEILQLFTHSDTFGYSVTLPAGSSKIEPGLTPAAPVTLHWRTFSDAADQAGISRRYGGIHFREGDLAGRRMGKLVARIVWEKATSLWAGG